jgi:hypothetical protein
MIISSTSRLHIIPSKFEDTHDEFATENKQKKSLFVREIHKLGLKKKQKALLSIKKRDTEKLKKTIFILIQAKPTVKKNRKKLGGDQHCLMSVRQG